MTTQSAHPLELWRDQRLTIGCSPRKSFFPNARADEQVGDYIDMEVSHHTHDGGWEGVDCGGRRELALFKEDGAQ